MTRGFCCGGGGGAAVLEFCGRYSSLLFCGITGFCTLFIFRDGGGGGGISFSNTLFLYLVGVCGTATVDEDVETIAGGGGGRLLRIGGGGAELYVCLGQPLEGGKGASGSLTSFCSVGIFPDGDETFDKWLLSLDGGGGGRLLSGGGGGGANSFFVAID